ncbi:hypothetical protein DsansV1_C09g0094901 [Dioscorea sansibarensis]
MNPQRMLPNRSFHLCEKVLYLSAAIFGIHPIKRKRHNESAMVAHASEEIGEIRGRRWRGFHRISPRSRSMGIGVEDEYETLRNKEAALNVRYSAFARAGSSLLLHKNPRFVLYLQRSLAS